MKTSKLSRENLRFYLAGKPPGRHMDLNAGWLKDLLDDCDDLDALINSPQTENFLEAVRTEAAHQVERWGNDDRAKKSDADWIWLMTYLASKAVFGKEQTHKINGLPLARWVADAARDYARAALKLVSVDPASEFVDGREKYLHRIITIAAAAQNWFNNRWPGAAP